jgi:hypothetical protein
VTRPAWMRSVLVGSLLSALAGCGTYIPFEKSLYAGEWACDTVRLRIRAEGWVRYEEFKDIGIAPFEGTASRFVEGPLKGFKGDDIQVGVGPVVKTITVNKTPYLDGDDWKMVVDGKELIRIAD